jgi:hypothetical protein
MIYLGMIFQYFSIFMYFNQPDTLFRIKRDFDGNLLK